MHSWSVEHLLLHNIHYDYSSITVLRKTTSCLERHDCAVEDAGP